MKISTPSDSILIQNLALSGITPLGSNILFNLSSEVDPLQKGSKLLTNMAIKTEAAHDLLKARKMSEVEMVYKS